MITHLNKHKLPRNCVTAVLFVLLTGLIAPVPIDAADTDGDGYFQGVTPFRVEYSVQRSGITLGKIIFSLSRNNEGLYSYEGRAEPGALLFWYQDSLANEKSSFYVVNGNVRSHRYEYFVGNGEDKHAMRAMFDWEKNTVDVVYNQKTRTLPLNPTTYDRAAVQLIVMHDLAIQKQSLNYDYVDRKKIRSYNFRRLGTEWLETGLGLLQVIKIESVYKSKKKDKEPRRTTFWCAKDYAYLPIKIEQQVGDGGISTMLIDKVEGKIVPSKTPKP